MYFTLQDILSRRERLAAQWDEILQADESVAIYSGEPIQKPGGLDQHYPFLPHPAYYWLTGRRRESEVVIYNKSLGWQLFQKEIPAEEAVWEGDRNDVLVFENGSPLNQLEGFIKQHKFAQVYKLGQSNRIEGKAFDLRTALDRTRRIKDSAEVSLIKHIAQIVGYGYKKLEEVIRPGISEKEIQIAYETEIFRRGSHKIPYDTIVGSGRNSAILHALPTDKIINENEFVLIDAGSDVYDYCVDITRTYPSSPQVSAQHQALYQLVLQAHTECIAMLKPGIFWRDVHIHAARVITEGLLQLGILKGNVNDLLEKEVVSVFFPHGVGHLVGLRVRDTGHEENLNPKTYVGARLRVDIELEANHLVTVEPGCYFIQSLLQGEKAQTKYKEDINWQELEKWKHIGGVRIEDNILITANGNENLTSLVPKKSVN